MTFEQKKILVLIFFVVFVLLCGVFICFAIIEEKKLESQPLQVEHVTVISKRTREDYGADTPTKQRFVAFVFSDGSKKEFSVEPTTYETLQEGDTGMLSYKELQSNIIRPKKNSKALKNLQNNNGVHRRTLFGE